MAEEKNSGVQSAVPSQPCLAKVVSHLDTTYMGSLEVMLLRPGAGNDSVSSQVQQVKYMSPFWGNTSIDSVCSQNDYNNTQKSYGMWMVPPDVGSTVVVIFINGDAARGYWIGCVPDENMNFMVPGIAATENSVTSGTADAAGRTGRLPVAEYNKLENNQNGDATRFKKPVHPIAAALEAQGLLLDDTRGITTSSARRETPSMVFGISTPGPFDKRQGAQVGHLGKSDCGVNNGPVSHLGGTTFVLDDGDDKFLRKTSASIGPPEYVSVEKGDTGGDVTIPHNELFRIRTRTGHQILLHNSEDLIYIGNSKGTTWIELTSNGKIDIFAEDSISIHTKQDFNLTADRDINFNAKNINLTASENFKVTASKNFEVVAGVDGLITLGGSQHIKSGGNCLITGAEIHLNGPAAAAATVAPVPTRIPDHEPWIGHENLDPAMFTPDKTVAVEPSQLTEPTPPTMYKQYTATMDTFNKGS
jgi:hypothetical protein